MVASGQRDQRVLRAEPIECKTDLCIVLRVSSPSPQPSLRQLSHFTDDKTEPQRRHVASQRHSSFPVSFQHMLTGHQPGSRSSWDTWVPSVLTSSRLFSDAERSKRGHTQTTVQLNVYVSQINTSTTTQRATKQCRRVIHKVIKGFMELTRMFL